MFLQISQNSQKSTKNGFRCRCFLVNSAKFLITLFLKNTSDGCFCINTRFFYCPNTTFCLFKNDVTHIFWLSIFSTYVVRWEQKWAQYLKPLARSLFSTQSNIRDGAFLAKIVNSLTPLGIFAEKLHCRCSTRFLMRLCQEPLKGVVKWKTKTWETFITLGNFVHWP